MTLKHLRQFGLIVVSFSALMFLVAFVLAGLDAPMWVVIVVVSLLLLGYIAGMRIWSRSAIRAGRAYYGQRRPTSTSSDAADDRIRDRRL